MWSPMAYGTNGKRHQWQTAPTLMSSPMANGTNGKRHQCQAAPSRMWSRLCSSAGAGNGSASLASTAQALTVQSNRTGSHSAEQQRTARGCKAAVCAAPHERHSSTAAQQHRLQRTAAQQHSSTACNAQQHSSTACNAQQHSSTAAPHAMHSSESPAHGALGSGELAVPEGMPCQWRRSTWQAWRQHTASVGAMR